MNKNQGIIITLLVVLIALVAYGVVTSKNSSDGFRNRNTNQSNDMMAEPVTATITKTNPASTNPNPAVPTNKTFSNTKYNVSVSYPKEFSITESNDRGFYNELNLYGLSIKMPSDYQKGTDLNTANIEITVSPSIKLCYSSNGADEDMTSIKTINGVSFHYNSKQPMDDAAMGGQRGTVSLFSTIKNNQCYRVTKTIGYRDLRGFSEPPYPAHFDEQKVNVDLDAIVSSVVIK